MTKPIAQKINRPMPIKMYLVFMIAIIDANMLFSKVIRLQAIRLSCG